jgi:hypothetical protein
MVRNVAIGVSLACLIGGAAYSADEDVRPKDGDAACNQKLASAEAALLDRLGAKTLSEENIDTINELLDKADAACTEGNMKAATRSLAKANRLLKEN